MRDADLAPAVEVIRAGNWGDRRESLAFFLTHPRSYPFVAESNRAIVGTSVATQNGTVGWVGLVFVAPALRGRGLGRDLTRVTLRCFEDLGCRSVVLAATDLGRPVYERLGFRPDGEYVVFKGPSRLEPVVDQRLRQLSPADLPAVEALDAQVSAEDRSHLIQTAREGWVLDDGTAIQGFALRTPWGSGPVITPDPHDGALLIEHLRRRGTTLEMRITSVAQNSAAVAHLERVGFNEERRVQRMVLGEPVAWQPDHVWTIFSFAVG
jgi:GNAT superfamily N-acetyltransferase